MSTSAKLSLPFLEAAQAQKHVTVNESLLRLDLVVQLSVKSATTTAQPGSPAEGDAYILGATHTGSSWASFTANHIAYFRDGTWEDVTPLAGWVAYVQDTGGLATFGGSVWSYLAATATLDTDGTLAANSDTRVASQKATKTYVDQIIAAQDAMVYKGATDCSGNPNYPAADRGHTYRVSVAGKIGGASGTVVEVGDMFICLTDGTASGTQAGVGANWNVIQVNIDGAVVGPASSTDNHVAFFNGATGKIIKDSGLALSGSNTGDQTITGTGDVTGSGTGSIAWTIATGAVTFAKVASAAVATLAELMAGTASKLVSADILRSSVTPVQLLCPAATTVTMTIASPCVVSWTSHGLVAGQPVVFTTTGALPTGITAGTTYYVIAAGLTANAFEVSATRGGSAVNTSGTQSGTHTATPHIYIDCSKGNNFYITLTRNVTFDVPQNTFDGQSGCIEIIQDGTGSRTGTWNASWDWNAATAPTLTTTASAWDLLSFYVPQKTHFPVGSLGLKAIG